MVFGGGWGEEVTLCRGDGTHQMVMSFSPSVLVVCLKIAYKGGGVTGTLGTPQ